MKQITLIFLLGMISFLSFGQTASDALRYSYWQYGGSARYVATGGSMGALGGDYSAVISNPASLATFRRSNFSFTPSVLISGTESSFDGSTFSGNKTSGNVNEASIVFASAKPGKWKTMNFGIGYNRLADFNQKFNYTGTTDGSITEYFAAKAQGTDINGLSDYDTWLALQSDVIFQPFEDNPTFYESDITAGDQTTKFQSISNAGSMGELNLSLGGNYDHKLYVGGSIGIPFVNFTRTKKYEETDNDNSIDVFNSLTFTEYLNTSGVGFNINLGAIYRVNQSVRIGAAFHSPTWLSLTDTYSNEMTADVTTVVEPETFESPIGNYEYSQRTPLRLIGDVGFIIKKLGFISAEVEWLNYGKNKYNFGDPSGAGDVEIENQVNNTINTIYQSAVNVKAGAEFVVAKEFRARAGYALMGNPYANDDGMFNGSQFSLGAGYRKNNYFVDIAYLHRTSSQSYQPYNLGEASPRIENDLTTDYILLTVGLKFGGRNTTKK